MQTPILTGNTIGAWVVAIIYDRVRVMTGIELNGLLCIAVIMIGVGLYLTYRRGDDITEKES